MLLLVLVVLEALVLFLVLAPLLYNQSTQTDVFSMLPSGLGRLGARAGTAHAGAGAGAVLKRPVRLVFMDLQGFGSFLDTTGGGRIMGTGRTEPGSRGS